MADVQTTYTEVAPIGVAGTKVDGEEYNAITRVAEAAVPFGKAVMRGSADLGCVVATAGMTAAQFLGISLRDVSVRYTPAGGYPARANVTVMSQGSIWVQVGEAVVPGDPVFYKPSDGKFYNDSQTATAAACGKWIFDSTAATNGLAKITRRGD